eukprot:jgi/Botrbrau1/9179/Bobra.0236s0011.2
MGARVMSLPAVLLVAFAVMNREALGEVQVRQVGPFNSISNCAPVSILVRSSNSGEAPYSVTIEADPAVLAVITTTVAELGLGIETNGSFSTNNPVKVTVRLPEKTLLYAETLQNGKADLGIKVENFSDIKGEIITNADGNVMVTGLNGGLVKLSTAAGANVQLNGTARYMEVRHAGSGDVYVSNLDGKAIVKNTETGNTFVFPAAKGNVTGFLEGPGALSVPAGSSCNLRVRDDGKKENACASTSLTGPPAQTLYWTCGISTTGSFNCGGGGKEAPGTFTRTDCAVPQSQLVMMGPNFSVE